MLCQATDGTLWDADRTIDGHGGGDTQEWRFGRDWLFRREAGSSARSNDRSLDRNL